MVVKQGKESGGRWNYRFGITINLTRLIVLLCGSILAVMAEDHGGYCFPLEQANECFIPFESSFCFSVRLDLKFPIETLEQPVLVSVDQFGC